MSRVLNPIHGSDVARKSRFDPNIRFATLDQQRRWRIARDDSHGACSVDLTSLRADEGTPSLIAQIHRKELLIKRFTNGQFAALAVLRQTPFRLMTITRNRPMKSMKRRTELLEFRARGLTAALGLLIALPWAVTACTVANDDERYVSQPPPGVAPELFAPGIVNTEAVELNGVFSPDFREFFFSRLIETEGSDDGYVYPGSTRPVVFHSVFANGAWSAPQPLLVYPDRSRAMSVDMALSIDGLELYFLGQYPDGEASLDLWVSRRVNGDWATAEIVPQPVSTEANEVYPVVVTDGSLYFSSNREGGLGSSDLWRAQRLPDGGFAEPVNLGPRVNSGHGEADTFVAPDESYMVLTSNRPGGYGSGDLYVSFRQADGGWGEPVNLGPEINSEELDYCPMVTPDGGYLFFSRRRSDPPDSGWAGVVEGDVYWVSALVIERHRPHTRAPSRAGP